MLISLTVFGRPFTVSAVSPDTPKEQTSGPHRLSEAPRGIVFDLDGTLVDTLPLVFEAFAEILAPYLGKRLRPDEISPHFGPPESQILAKFIPKDRLDSELERLHQYYSDHPDRVVVFSELKPFLQDLKKWDVRTAVFTGKGRQGTRITLEQAGIIHDLETWVTGDDTLHPKPDPEGLLILLEGWRLHPRTVWMVGDTPSDIKAGRAAGVVTIGVLWGTPDRQAVLDSRPDIVCESPTEFVDFCRKSLD